MNASSAPEETRHAQVARVRRINCSIGILRTAGSITRSDLINRARMDKVLSTLMEGQRVTITTLSLKDRVGRKPVVYSWRGDAPFLGG